MNIQEETRKFYETTAQRTFDEWFDNETLLPLLKDFVGKLPDKPEVLDLGCGTGGESKRLSRLGARVLGVDFSAESIRLASEHVPEAKFRVLDILELDLPPASFHGVLDAAVLFHFTKEEQDRILDDIRRILKPGGILFSIYPEGDTEGPETIVLDGEQYRRYIRRIGIDEWRSQVLEAGFVSYDRVDFNFHSFTATEFYAK